MRCSNGLCELFDSLADELSPFRREGPHAAKKGHLVWNDIIAAAGMNGTNGKNGGVEWVEIPADDALQGEDQFSSADDAVMREVGAGGMASVALKHDLKHILGSGYRSCMQTNST